MYQMHTHQRIVRWWKCNPFPTGVYLLKVNNSDTRWRQQQCRSGVSFLRIWSHLLEKSLMKNFIFCAVSANAFFVFQDHRRYHFLDFILQCILNQIHKIFHIQKLNTNILVTLYQFMWQTWYSNLAIRFVYLFWFFLHLTCKTLKKMTSVFMLLWGALNADEICRNLSIMQPQQQTRTHQEIFKPPQ